jgi:hypothetical protein
MERRRHDLRRDHAWCLSVLLDNEGDVLEATAEVIRATGAKVEAVVGDVSRREDVHKAVELAVRAGTGVNRQSARHSSVRATSRRGLETRLASPRAIVVRTLIERGTRSPA